MTEHTGIYDEDARAAASQEQEAKWEIEVDGEDHQAGECGERALWIFAIKEGEKRRHIYSLSTIANDAEIEKVARGALHFVCQLNAGLYSAKSRTHDKLLDVIETIKGETSE